MTPEQEAQETAAAIVKMVREDFAAGLKTPSDTEKMKPQAAQGIDGFFRQLAARRPDDCDYVRTGMGVTDRLIPQIKR